MAPVVSILLALTKGVEVLTINRERMRKQSERLKQKGKRNIQNGKGSRVLFKGRR